MAPGRRVSQLMNVAFDMAAWVSLFCTIPLVLTSARKFLARSVMVLLYACEERPRRNGEQS